MNVIATEGATRRVLVLAMPNVRCEELLRTMREHSETGDASFSLVVPAVPLGLDWLADMSAGREIAEQRLESLLWRCRKASHAIVEAEIGDPDPLAAAMDAVNFGQFDEIVLAAPTPSRAASVIRMGLADRIRRATGLPVHHVVSAPAVRIAKVPATHRAELELGRAQVAAA